MLVTGWVNQRLTMPPFPESQQVGGLMNFLSRTPLRGDVSSLSDSLYTLEKKDGDPKGFHFTSTRGTEDLK